MIACIFRIEKNKIKNCIEAGVRMMGTRRWGRGKTFAVCGGLKENAPQGKWHY